MLQNSLDSRVGTIESAQGYRSGLAVQHCSRRAVHVAMSMLLELAAVPEALHPRRDRILDRAPSNAENQAIVAEEDGLPAQVALAVLIRMPGYLNSLEKRYCT